MKSKRLSIIAGLFLLAGAALAGIAVEHDEGADFTSYRTYTWKEGAPAVNAEVQAHIERSIDEQLAAKGLRKVVREKPDLYVSTYAHSFTGMHVGSTYIYAPRYDVGITSIRAEDITTGTLMVDLIEVDSNRAVWQGVAQEKFGNREPAKIKKKIGKITKKMFKNFPPS